jgi:putative nucleotidyltransferase with HDIG domain
MAAAGRRIELIISRLHSLATLPAVASQLLSQISNPVALAQIIESDPALSARILSLAHSQGIRFAGRGASVCEALAVLPDSVVRETVLSVRIFEALDAGYIPEWRQTLPHKQLTIHSLAVACCTKNLAELVLPQPEWELAFSAGLLHDIGKLALAEVMPKSFERIMAEAKAQGLTSSGVEERYLGIDHTVLGKRLAEKWHLPAEMVFAIWLHHNDTGIVSEDIPAGRIAPLVNLADLIACKANIGESGSYGSTDSTIYQAAAAFSLNDEQIGQIRERLGEEVMRRSRILGLDTHCPTVAYCETIRNTAVQLSGDNTRLSIQNRQLVSNSAHLDFVTEFFTTIGSGVTTVEIAENFAVRWQKFYQTGPVCIYLVDTSQEKFLEAVVIDELGCGKSFVLELPENCLVLPAELQKDFVILDASECIGWLFEQLEEDFDLGKAKVAPLLTRDETIGVIVFEQRYPAEFGERLAGFAAVASIGAAVISLSLRCEQQTRLSEQFAEFLGKMREAQHRTTESESLSGLAEMAAGAAHELNNPLAVISGRVQLLAGSETDFEKRRVLSQIRDKTREISDIIVDLVNYAKPLPPVPSAVSVQLLLEQTIKETAEMYEAVSLDVRMKNVGDLGNVFVDSKQVVSALVKILSNALGSYPNGKGPIRIVGARDESGDFARLQITDFGCGMSADVLQKATKPFFSDRPAGRKRGMGLAHAHRLLQLNKGSLRLASRRGGGTTVTILLPRK